MINYGIRLLKHSSDIFSVLTFVIFTFSVFSNWVNIDNENIEKLRPVFSHFSILLLFILLFRSGYKVWNEEASKHIKPVFTLIPRANCLTLQNPGTNHPDSQGNIFFELNVSNTSGSDFTVKDIDLTELDPLERFFSEKCRSRFVDLQNNHQEFRLPKKITNGASEQFFIELSYLPVSLSKEDTKYPTVPSHIIEFAPKLRDIEDFYGRVEIIYLLKGEIIKKTMKIKIPLTLYKEHFLKKWQEYKWDHAVTLSNYIR